MDQQHPRQSRQGDVFLAPVEADACAPEVES
jgi:hypothetical protein